MTAGSVQLSHGWVSGAGFVFVALTAIPIVIGIHIGIFYHHETAGAFIGALAGLALAIWIVIRPLWLEATDKKDDSANSHNRE